MVVVSLSTVPVLTVTNGNAGSVRLVEMLHVCIGHYISQFMEITDYEILIDKKKWKPGDNSRKNDYYFNLINDIILNALALSQKKEDRTPMPILLMNFQIKRNLVTDS